MTPKINQTFRYKTGEPRTCPLLTSPSSPSFVRLRQCLIQIHSSSWRANASWQAKWCCMALYSGYSYLLLLVNFLCSLPMTEKAHQTSSNGGKKSICIRFKSAYQVRALKWGEGCVFQSMNMCLCFVDNKIKNNVYFFENEYLLECHMLYFCFSLWQSVKILKSSCFSSRFIMLILFICAMHIKTYKIFMKEHFKYLCLFINFFWFCCVFLCFI